MDNRSAPPPRFPRKLFISDDEIKPLQIMRELTSVMLPLVERLSEIAEQCPSDESLLKARIQLVLNGASLAHGPLMFGRLVLEPGRAYWLVRELLGEEEREYLARMLGPDDRLLLNRALCLDRHLREASGLDNVANS